jgi:predicted MFS family arabinose efflux permease
MSAIGFRWTTRAIALVMLVTLLIPLGVLQLLSQPGPATRRRDFFNLESFKSKPFLLFCIANFFGFGAIYIIFFYVQLYALEKTDMSASLASYLLCVINATSTLGRLVPNFIADTTGPLNVQVPFAMISGVLCFGWIGINTSASLLAFCCLYGFFAGSFVSLPGTIAVTLSPDLSAIGIQVSLKFFCTLLRELKSLRSPKANLSRLSLLSLKKNADF